MIIKLEHGDPIDLIFPSKVEIVNYENLKSVHDGNNNTV